MSVYSIHSINLGWNWYDRRTFRWFKGIIMKSTSVIDAFFLLIKTFPHSIFYHSKHATIKNCYENNSKEKNRIIFAIKKSLQYLHSISKSKKVFIVKIQNCMQFQLQQGVDERVIRKSFPRRSWFDCRYFCNNFSMGRNSVQFSYVSIVLHCINLLFIYLHFSYAYNIIMSYFSAFPLCTKP